MLLFAGRWVVVLTYSALKAAEGGRYCGTTCTVQYKCGLMEPSEPKNRKYTQYGVVYDLRIDSDCGDI